MSQRKYTIELRVDFADDGKKPAMQQTVLDSARRMFATAALLTDLVEPDIAIWSEDFYSGREDLKLLDDLVQTGEQQLVAAGSPHQTEEISEELISLYNDKRGV